LIGFECLSIRFESGAARESRGSKRQKVRAIPIWKKNVSRLASFIPDCFGNASEISPGRPPFVAIDRFPAAIVIAGSRVIRRALTARSPKNETRPGGGR
jgi:hypothetical protein